MIEKTECFGLSGAWDNLSPKERDLIEVVCKLYAEKMPWGPKESAAEFLLQCLRDGRLLIELSMARQAVRLIPSASVVASRGTA